jgi:hypothetical protein
MRIKYHFPRKWADVPTRMLLSASVLAAVGPLVMNVYAEQFTPLAILGMTPGLFWCVFIFASWKPVVAFRKAVQRANAEQELSEPLFARALALRDLMSTQKQTLESAHDPAEHSDAENALRQTMTELEEIVDVLTPRLDLVSQAIAEADAWNERFPHRRALAWARRSLVSGLTDLAVAVAGDRGARLRDTWMADIAGAPEEGLTLSRWQQVGHAAGFMIAAIRMRSRALSEPMWRPVDWVLASESRSRSVITLAVGALVIYIVKHDGLHGLLTDGWGWCGGCAVALHLFFRWLRKVRGVDLAVVDQNPPQN